jgi:hypothetical protein
MATTEKWIGGSGQGLTWGNAFTGSTLNSIANGNAILSDLQIDNSSAFDIFSDVSINLASLAAVAPNFVGVYLYPLNADGSTYGDGQFGSSAAGPPSSTYWVGNIVITAVTAVQEGTVRGIILPPGKFKFVLYNQAGVAFAGSGNTCQYRTYNRSIA